MRIAIVDDIADERALLKTRLERQLSLCVAEAEVLEFDSGESFLAAVKERRFAHMINIRTTAGKTLATRQSFKVFTEPLKKDARFFVCGRGVIVNLEHAADFQDAAFCMTDGSRVYVSQELSKPARQAFMEFLLQRGRIS